LLILVVVGASATASLIVGGLIFALASRRRGVAKNVSKLQLSDDIEESGKLQQQQEGYKVLVRVYYLKILGTKILEVSKPFRVKLENT
jgi:hypothetical protein